MKCDKILIVGGGSAGWMTAATLIKAYPKKDITVLESPNIPTISVGESTINAVKHWTKFLGIKDEEFLKHTDGTVKFSIKFTDFNGKDEAPFYYPFGPVVTEGTQFGYNDWWMKKAFNPELPVSDYADSYAPVMALVNQRKGCFNFKIPGMKMGQIQEFDIDRDSAYQFDAIKFGIWLRDHYCIPRGVKHIKEHIEDIKQDENGIVSLNGKHKADLYVDCTGFKSLLLGGALKEPFEPVKNLPNNKAWVTKIPYVDKTKEVEAFTNCTAIENGWVWNIPLWSRVGAGYVYSDKFVDDETALKEFKNHLAKVRPGYGTEEHEFRNIKMKCGIHQRLFVKNVVAIGLSAGFIEPLESNGLFSVHEFLMMLVRNIARDKITQWDKDNFSFACKYTYNRFLEFVGMHYALSTRDDTEYWKAINNTVWEESLYTFKAKINLGYFQAALHRNLSSEFPVDPSSNPGRSGIHFIAAGFNWAPQDLPNLVNTTHKSEEEIREYMAPFIRKLDERKAKWNKEVEKFPSYHDFIEKVYYK
jgi:flavin-dependent dehydrogenase